MSPKYGIAHSVPAYGKFSFPFQEKSGLSPGCGITGLWVSFLVLIFPTLQSFVYTRFLESQLELSWGTNEVMSEMLSIASGA